MRKHPMCKYFITGLLLLSATLATAQNAARFFSKLPVITKAGFYRINLQPAVVANCQDNLEDLRLLDTASRQVPFVIQTDPPAFTENSFIELPVLSTELAPDKQTHITIGNTSNKTISKLLLEIKNTDANRFVTVSGSDDNKQWFVIKENILLYNVSVPDKDRFVQYLDFPNSSYKFFKIIIHGKNLLPVNIVKVGIFDGVQRPGNYTALPAPAIVQKDSSNRNTYLSIRLKENYRVNKLIITVTGPKFFKRNFSVYNNTLNSPLQTSYFISSEVTPAYTMDTRARSLTAVIGNDDNPPLQIVAVATYQLNKYLSAYLEPGIDYHLSFGDSLATAPAYDLAFFKNQMANSYADISTGAVIRSNVSATSGAAKFNGSGTFILWSIIGAVLVLMLVLTVRMTREIRNKPTGEG